MQESLQRTAKKDAEFLLLQLASQDKNYRALLHREEDLIQIPAAQQLLQAMVREDCDVETLLRRGLEGEVADCAAAVAVLPAVENAENCYVDCVEFLRRVHIEDQLKQLQEQASDKMLTTEERIQLVIRINNLNTKLDELAKAAAERGEGFER